MGRNDTGGSTRYIPPHPVTNNIDILSSRKESDVFAISSKGSFKNTEKFLQSMSKGDIFRSLDKYGQ